MNKYKDLPEMLHEWYLEAIKGLGPEGYNPNAAVSWDKLSEEQQYIDTYIADRIKSTFLIRVPYERNGKYGNPVPKDMKLRGIDWPTYECDCADKDNHYSGCINFMY